MTARSIAAPSPSQPLCSELSRSRGLDEGPAAPNPDTHTVTSVGVRLALLTDSGKAGSIVGVKILSWLGLSSLTALGCSGAPDFPPTLDDTSCSIAAHCDKDAGAGDGGAAGGSGGGGGTQADCVISNTPEDLPMPSSASIDISGSIGAMTPPKFSPFPIDLVPLDRPAKVHVPLDTTDYVAPYDSVDGWQLKGLPSGNTIVMVEDIDDGNGVLNSVQDAIVQASSPWALFATRRADLQAIYATDSAIQLDSEKAQIILSISSSDINGSHPIPNLRFAAPLADAIFFDNADAGSGFGRDPAKTGPNGLAIIANITAESYPGQVVTLLCATGSTTQSFKFRTVRGAVTRASINLQSTGSD
jgi:hypothetical protein